MPSSRRIAVPRAMLLLAAGAALTAAQPLQAQRESRPPAATQGFASSDCASGCTIDTLVIDVDRGRRAQPGVVTATVTLIDTIALARRGAPPAPRERSVALWMSCDSAPCAAVLASGRVSDKRIDDARVVRRTSVTWPLPGPAILQLARAGTAQLHADGRPHLLLPPTVAAVRALIASVRSSIPSGTYSPRAVLYLATFAAFGLPADSIIAEDVGTATEPLMIPDANVTLPTRVATLTVVGRGASALPVLVQDDATGAAPIFGVGETVVIALPGRTGRRGVVRGKVTARQRVEAFRDSCQGMKVWTYLVALPPADLAAAQRGMLSPVRPTEAFDRWNGTAVREVIAARMLAAEQRSLAASRAVVAQFVRERAPSGLSERDVQVLAALPRNAGFVTNFGVLARDGGGNWRFPTLSLRPASCPAP